MKKIREFLIWCDSKLSNIFTFLYKGDIIMHILVSIILAQAFTILLYVAMPDKILSPVVATISIGLINYPKEWLVDKNMKGEEPSIRDFLAGLIGGATWSFYTYILLLL